MGSMTYLDNYRVREESEAQQRKEALARFERAEEPRRLRERRETFWFVMTLCALSALTILFVAGLLT